MSWHTHYRPRSVADLHLKIVRERLQQLLKSGALSQVLLFAGPKGTGKTSAARVIGAIVNDPINEKAVESSFFNNDSKASKSGLSFKDTKADFPLADQIFQGKSYVVNEMDAASNRGIDDVRALKDRVALPPSQGKMSVYILDEAHMLTTEAFNALLKLLEEPPAHAMFILATTELHKIPATIASRALTITFQHANQDEITEALENIAKKEKITVGSEALERISQSAEGSFRDAVKVFEEIGSGQKEVTLEQVLEIVKTLDQDALKHLVDQVIGKDEQALVKTLQEFRARGLNSQVVLKQLLVFLHNDLLMALEVEDGQAQYSAKISHFLLNHLQAVQEPVGSSIPLLGLELALLELIWKAQQGKDGSGSKQVSKAAAIKPKEKVVRQASSSQDFKDVSFEPSKKKAYSDDVSDSSSINHQIREPISELQNVVPVEGVDSVALLNDWKQFVSQVEVQNSTVAAMLRSGKPLPEQSNGVAKIEVFYDFHREQLSQPKFINLLQECAAKMIGGRPAFEFILSKPEDKPSLPLDISAASPEKSTLDNAQLVKPLVANQEKDKSELVSLADQHLM